MAENFSLLCSDATPTLLGVFDLSIAPALLFYSYIPIVLISLLLGIYVLLKDKFSTQSILLLILIASFSLFLTNELILWVATPASLVMFSWSLALLLRFLILVSTVYFLYYFTKKALPNFYENLLLFAISLPIILLLPTKLNTSTFDLDLCEGTSGILWSYLNILEIATVLVFILSTVICVKRYLNNRNRDAMIKIYISTASLIFFVIFAASQQFGEYMGVYEVNLYGPFGMLIFIFTLSYASIQYKVFRIELAAPIALVLGLWALVFSLLFIHSIDNIRFIVSLTLLGLIIFGGALIRSIKRERSQKMEIQKLATRLETANVRLEQMDKLKSEFVSIASHQLRSPITAISGYASLMREGSYGELTAKLKEPVERIEQSARMMASSIEDYLNVSRIESGNMKYNNSDFNLAEQAEHICDDLRSEALRRGLIILFKKKLEGTGTINADIGKVQQIIHNLINNSIKYTPKGTITVYVHDEPKQKKIFIDILDTGIGMSVATINSIFQKFERGDKANTVNVKGTGLGLYVALKMAQAMSGTISAHSEGEGMGSRFTIELPLLG